MSQLDAIKKAAGAEGFRGSEWRNEVFRRLRKTGIIKGLRAVGLTQGAAAAYIDAAEAELQTLRRCAACTRALRTEARPSVRRPGVAGWGGRFSAAEKARRWWAAAQCCC